MEEFVLVFACLSLFLSTPHVVDGWDCACVCTYFSHFLVQNLKNTFEWLDEWMIMCTQTDTLYYVCPYICIHLLAPITPPVHLILDFPILIPAIPTKTSSVWALGNFKQ